MDSFSLLAACLHQQGPQCEDASCHAVIAESMKVDTLQLQILTLGESVTIVAGQIHRSEPTVPAFVGKATKQRSHLISCGSMLGIVLSLYIVGPAVLTLLSTYRAASIGQGVQFMNKHLSSQIMLERKVGMAPLFEFLRMHKYQGESLMINNGRIQSLDDLK